MGSAEGTGVGGSEGRGEGRAEGGAVGASVGGSEGWAVGGSDEGAGVGPQDGVTRKFLRFDAGRPVALTMARRMAAAWAGSGPAH